MTYFTQISRPSGELENLKQAIEKVMALLAPPAGQRPENMATRQLHQLLLAGLTDDPAVVLSEQILHVRRQRDKIFGADLFADPGWDMLLDLFVARERGLRPVSTSSLCIASAVPQTTALRWIHTMVQRGLLSRKGDPKDGRRTFIGLTDDASLKMRELLTSWVEKT